MMSLDLAETLASCITQKAWRISFFSFTIGNIYLKSRWLRINLKVTKTTFMHIR